MKRLLTVAFAALLLVQPVRAEKPLNLTFATAFVVFPQDANANPPMAFGGKLLSEMDRCAGITTRRLLYASPTGARDAVTVGIRDVAFHKPAKVKDLLVVTGAVIVVRNKAIEVRVFVERETDDGNRELLVEGVFTYVAFDLEKKRAVEHGIAIREK